jgi:hypothetical protein
MKRNSFKITAALIAFLLIIFPALSFAQITNPLGSNTSIPEFISQVLGDVVKVGGIIAVFAFIWVGYLFVQAQGRPTELQKARDTFIYTCIGVAVLLGAQLIASIIVGTLNSLK